MIDVRKLSRVVEVYQSDKDGTWRQLQHVPTNPRKWQFCMKHGEVYVRYRRKGDQVIAIWEPIQRMFREWL